MTSAFLTFSQRCEEQKKPVGKHNHQTPVRGSPIDDHATKGGAVMYLEDLSFRLGAANAIAAEDSLNHAASIVREMVNPLESVNNLAYLLCLSAEEPDQVVQLIAMLQSQLTILNEVVQGTLDAAKDVHDPESAKTPRV